MAEIELNVLVGQCLNRRMGSFDQVVAAVPYANSATDAELVRVAVGKAPSEIALVARTMVPPVVDDDKALYERRALRMSWTRGGLLPPSSGGRFPSR